MEFKGTFTKPFKKWQENHGCPPTNALVTAPLSIGADVYKTWPCDLLPLLTRGLVSIVALSLPCIRDLHPRPYSVVMGYGKRCREEKEREGETPKHPLCWLDGRPASCGSAVYDWSALFNWPTLFAVGRSNKIQMFFYNHGLQNIIRRGNLMQIKFYKGFLQLVLMSS